MDSDTTPTTKNSNVGAYVLIVIGAYFLLKKLGWMPNILPLIANWWPVVLITIGVFILIRNTTDKEP